MESALDAVGPLALVVLALVDATSMGTLVIPVILLVTASGRAAGVAGRTLLFLVVIGVFYLALGIALLAGLLPLVERYGHLLGSLPIMALGAVAGLLLVIWSFRIDPAAVAKRGGDPEASARKWTDRVRRAAGSPRLLAGLAVVAGLAEAATMIPYLAAMGIISDMGLGLGAGSLALTGYCAIMIAPAAVLCGVRAALGGRADRALDRVHGWAVKHVGGAFSWAVGIVGALLLLNTAGPVIAALQGG